MKQNVTDLIAVLPSALQQVSAIRENEDQTRTQQEEALRELKAADPKVWLIRGVNCLAQFNLNLLQVHDVLRFIFHQFKPRHPHGKPSHQGIGGFERQGGFGGPRGQQQFKFPVVKCDDILEKRNLQKWVAKSEEIT